MRRLESNLHASVGKSAIKHKAQSTNAPMLFASKVRRIQRSVF